MSFFSLSILYSNETHMRRSGWYVWWFRTANTLFVDLTFSNSDTVCVFCLVSSLVFVMPAPDSQASTVCKTDRIVVKFPKKKGTKHRRLCFRMNRNTYINWQSQPSLCMGMCELHFTRKCTTLQALLNLGRFFICSHNYSMLNLFLFIKSVRSWSPSTKNSHFAQKSHFGVDHCAFVYVWQIDINKVKGIIIADDSNIW